MDTLTKIILTSAAIAAVSGCKDFRTEYSEIKTEQAIVVDKTHYIGDYLDNKYVQFKGPIYFSVKSAASYDNLARGDTVKVYYQEQYLVKYDYKDGKKIKEPVSKELVDYRFCEAKKK